MTFVITEPQIGRSGALIVVPDVTFASLDSRKPADSAPVVVIKLYS